MVLFLIGILEMIIVSTWTKLVAETRVLWSGAVTFINILIWYYVLETIVNDIGNWQLVILYAVGCAIGTMAGTYFSRLYDKKK